MKTSDSIAVASVRLFETGDLPSIFNLSKGRQIFAYGLSKRLALALASICALFKAITQKKFVSRGMNKSYEYEP